MRTLTVAIVALMLAAVVPLAYVGAVSTSKYSGTITIDGDDTVVSPLWWHQWEYSQLRGALGFADDLAGTGDTLEGLADTADEVLAEG